MQTSNLWNKLHLRWPQAVIIVFSLICLGAANLNAQKKKKNTSTKSRTLNLPGYDDQWLHYGFQIGIFQSGMKLQYSTTRQDTIRIEQNPSFSLGFNLSFQTANDLLAVRFVPNVAFFERTIKFSSRNPLAEREDQIYESSVIELPVLLKYKSRRRKNHGMYMVAGFTPSIEVGGKATSDLEGISFRKSNMELNYGVGFDFYWTFFKFAPELRFSHGISNILSYSNNIYSSQIDRILTHKVTLYLNFE